MLSKLKIKYQEIIIKNERKQGRQGNSRGKFRYSL